MDITENFNLQADTIIEFNQYLHDKTYNEDRESLGICVLELLYELLEKWSTHSQTEHLWKETLPEDLGDTLLVYAYDDVNDVRIEILINKDGIFLEMSIACPENLPGMPDDFWQQWLDLNSFGSFELIENEPFSDHDKKNNPGLFPAEAGNLFTLMRSIIAFPLIYKRPIEWCDLSINWPFDQYSIKDVFEKGCGAFERLWYLNQRLIVGK